MSDVLRLTTTSLVVLPEETVLPFVMWTERGSIFLLRSSVLSAPSSRWTSSVGGGTDSWPRESTGSMVALGSPFYCREIFTFFCVACKVKYPLFTSVRVRPIIEPWPEVPGLHYMKQKRTLGTLEGPNRLSRIVLSPTIFIRLRDSSNPRVR